MSGLLLGDRRTLRSGGVAAPLAEEQISSASRAEHVPVGHRCSVSTFDLTESVRLLPSSRA